MDKLLEFSIKNNPSSDEDYERIGYNLAAFTKQQVGWCNKTLSKTFQAVSDGGKVIGELIAEVNPSWGYSEIKMAYVEKEYRGIGVGADLLNVAETFLKARKAKHVRLWTPTFQGEGFYEQHNYEEKVRLPLKDGHENILYTKTFEG